MPSFFSSPSRRADLLGLLFVILSFLVAFWLYPRLPYHVPVHWNINGRVNGTMAKPWGVFFTPLVMLALWVVFLALPAISPKGFRMDNFRSVYDVVRLAVLGFLFLITSVTLLAGAGYPLPIPLIVSTLLGVFLIVLGNFLPKIRKNFFVGVRTPWTLANDEVWLKTHRLAGWVFVFGGLAIVVEGLAGGSEIAWLLPATLILIVLVPILGSYVLYRRVAQSP